MARNALDRAWNRLVGRYAAADESDCCGSEIEEIQSDAADGELDCGCE